MKASIRELKDHLSMYMHEVESGKEVVVTSHKRPIAKIIPFEAKAVGKVAARKKLIADLSDLDKRMETHHLIEPLSQTVIDMRNKERF